MWAACHDLEEVLPCFQSITSDITKTPIKCNLENVEVTVNPPEWDGYITSDTDDTLIEEKEEQKSLDEKLTDFQKLILIKNFQEEKVCPLLKLYFSEH